MYAIIGGSGLAQLSALTDFRRQAVATAYGEPSAPLVFGKLGGHELVFLARHGAGHHLPPHRINYRANIDALRQAGVHGILALATVGGITARFGPGTLAVPEQLIDYTHGRAATFYDGGDAPVVHVDFTQPYTPALRARLLAAAQTCGEAIVDGGVYACAQGPRLETAAEIERFARDGADLVGMTGMPEAALAREAGLPYATLAVVVNHAAGRGDSRDGIRSDDLQAVMEATVARAVRVLTQAVAQEAP
ncbi:MAG: S-methyl-5'-thioinosine phosphorylase [Burkholderiales bacterium]|jgi:5'-methylthioadenosine phosphorylase|nr:S-methyl-5'-thioinosine phosphorylase [Burkholderiales bacterium]